MIDQYLQQEAERGALGIPARPLDPEQTAEPAGFWKTRRQGRRSSSCTF